MTKQEALQDPKEAYAWAMRYGPCDETRQAACKDTCYAYCYAEDVDLCSKDDTRLAACKDPYWAYCYAKYVDKCSRDDTRLSACQSPQYAYWYAKYVDKQSRDDTRLAACKDSFYAYWYAKYIDKSFHKETWQAVQGSDYEQDYISNIGVSMDYQIKDHTGKVYNPISGEWKWL